jgi:NAD(P)-dependent dehydrogenase (short-subunit alcohol dehydrogenase family)
MSEIIRPGTGKTAIVTGAARGIGRQVAIQLAEAGYALGLMDVNELEIDSLVDLLEENGAAVQVAFISVCDEQSISSTFEWLSLNMPLQLVVNCAGVGLFASVEETDAKSWQKLIDINLTGTFLCAREAFIRMKKAGGGHIINVVSIAGKEAFPLQSAYCASKWGVLGLTKVLAMEGRPHGIRVTAVCPGAVNTEFWDTVDHTFDVSAMLDVSHVASTIVYLATHPGAVGVDEITLLPPRGVL